MERERRRRTLQKQEMLKKKKRKQTVTAAGAVIVMALAAGTGGFLGMRSFSHYQYQKFEDEKAWTQGFVPLEQVLKLSGYVKEKAAEADAAFYIKKEPEICLTINRELTVLKKNHYRFPIENEVRMMGNEIYVAKDFLESIINAEIFWDEQEGYQQKEKVFAPGEWADGEIPLIAHAGGGILEKDENGKLIQHTYTNSREAFTASYEKGYRVIELDFRLSKDGDWCALHNWKSFGGKQRTAQWKEQKIENLYTTLTLEDVLKEMEVNQDLYVILDAKSYDWSDEEVVEQYQKIYEQALDAGGEGVVRRLIPQIYEQSEYELIKSVYGWSSIIYTLYRSDDVPDEEIVSFVKEKEDIHVVTIPKRRVEEGFCQALHDAGKKVYTHTINETDSLYEWMNKGVDGFYTDTVTPDAWRARYF